MSFRFIASFIVASAAISPTYAHALSTNPIVGVYVHANGNVYEIDQSQSMPNIGVVVETQQVIGGVYRARVSVPLPQWYSSEGIGILLNTVGQNAARCSLDNMISYNSPISVSFDVYCALPVNTSTWQYTMSDFQFVVHNAYVATGNIFTVVQPNGTFSINSPFTEYGVGLQTFRNAIGYYKIVARTNTSADSSNIQITTVGDPSVVCEVHNQRFTPYTNGSADVIFYVGCVDAVGQQVDSAFRVEVNSYTVPGPGGGYLSSDDPYQGGVTPSRLFSNFSSSTTASLAALSSGTGQWLLYRNYPTNYEARIASFVTSARRPNEDETLPIGNYCKVDQRFPTSSDYWVRIRCYHFDGTPVWATFNELSTYR